MHIRAERYRIAENLRIGYEPVPRTAGRGYNSLGYRDDDHVSEKQAGTYRIVILGDSIAVGAMIARRKHTFPFSLQRKLRRVHGNVEIINLGVHGYNTQQEVATLEDRGLRFQPDLVLLQVCQNDFGHGSHITGILQRRWNRKKGFHSSEFLPYLRKSALYRLVQYRLFPGSLDARRKERASSFNGLRRDSVSPNMARLARLSSKYGFKVLVTVFPAFDEASKKVKKASILKSDWRSRVREMSKRHRFNHLDLTTAFTQCEMRSRKPLAMDIVHPTEPGHECAATAIKRFIVTEGIIMGDAQAPR